MNVDSAASRLASQGVAYAPQIASAARRHGVDPDLLAAVAAQETGGPGSNAGRNVVGDGGHGRGLFQIDDRWHAFAESPGAMNPGQNADYAAGMISGLLSRYGGTSIAHCRPTTPAVPTRPAPRRSGPTGAASATPTRSSSTTLVSRDPLLLAPAIPAGSQGSNDETGDPQETAVAELRTLIAELGALQSHAQSMPALTPPQQLAQPQPYQQQVADYAGLLSGDDGN